MTRTKAQRIIAGLAAPAILMLSSGALAGSADFGDFKLTYGGYIKADAMFTDFSDGSVAGSSIGRVWYVPSTIPVGGDGGDGVWDFHARQSRWFFQTDGEIDGHKVSGRFEFDFMVSPGGDERISNSYNPRVRHAFLTYDNWLFGQTWSVFQNPGALPDTLDFIGPTESTVFVRQAQVRYTNGPWAFSIENPETTLYTAAMDGSRTVNDESSIPDFAARYNYTADWGNIYVSGLLRYLQLDNTAQDDEEASYGVSVSGVYKVGSGGNDIRFMATWGQGMGRYFGLNLAPGGVITSSGSIEAIDSFGAYAAYRHVWNKNWRSTFLYGMTEIDNPTSDTGTGVTESVWHGSVNLIYSPVPQISIGGELQFAERELENGVDGDMTRWQFSAKYSF